MPKKLRRTIKCRLNPFWGLKGTFGSVKCQWHLTVQGAS